MDGGVKHHPFFRFGFVLKKGFYTGALTQEP